MRNRTSQYMNYTVSWHLITRKEQEAASSYRCWRRQANPIPARLFRYLTDFQPCVSPLWLLLPSQDEDDCTYNGSITGSMTEGICKLTWSRYNFGKQYHRADFDLRLLVGPADLKFQLWSKNKQLSKDHEEIEVQWNPALTGRQSVCVAENEGMYKFWEKLTLR